MRLLHRVPPWTHLKSARRILSSPSFIEDLIRSANCSSPQILRPRKRFKNWHGCQFLNRFRVATATDGGVQKLYRVFAPQKLEVHELTRTSIHEPNTDVAHYQGRRSIYNICILNYCKLTFEFFKNVIFEKRRQFLNQR